mgnify:CR=1 FL=1
MPDDCPESKANCSHAEISLDVSDEELNSVIEKWVEERSFTSTFSEGHVVDRTLFMQFPDDLLYRNNCGTVELHSQSRLGLGDFGVNAERIDDLINHLQNYDWETTC